MEKARLSVSRTKKGKFVIKAIFHDNKGVTIQGFHHQDPISLNGKEVEVEREKGQVIKVVLENKVIFSKAGQQSGFFSKVTRPRRSGYEKKIGVATAPYNFIPLNDKVIQAEEIPHFDKYHPDRYTGYIDLKIKTLTPLYIRDTLTPEEYEKKEQCEREEKSYINPAFFSPGGIPRIPGSSLRGMTRTMVEIMSYGKFGFFDDKRLYYRGLGDRSSLRKEYQSNMSSYDKNSKKTLYKMSAGILNRKGFDYYITPSKGFRQILKQEAKNQISRLGKEYEELKWSPKIAQHTELV